jgi:hypothetical protein
VAPKTDTSRPVPWLVDTRTAARILGKSPNTLKRWRYEGVEPDYVNHRGRIQYDVAVLLEFIRKHTRVPSVRAMLEDTRGIASEEEVQVLLV